MTDSNSPRLISTPRVKRRVSSISSRREKAVRVAIVRRRREKVPVPETQCKAVRGLRKLAVDGVFLATGVDRVIRLVQDWQRAGAKLCQGSFA
jgi:hypothetical protein